MPGVCSGLAAGVGSLQIRNLLILCASVRQMEKGIESCEEIRFIVGGAYEGKGEMSCGRCQKGLV